MDKLRSLADGKTIVTMLTHLNHATLDVIANVNQAIFFCKLYF